MEQMEGDELFFQRFQIIDALSYLKQVKSKFGNESQAYEVLLNFLDMFRTHRIDTNDLVARVSVLFNDYPELLVRFNSFLPPEYVIGSQSDEQVQHGDSGSSMSLHVLCVAAYIVQNRIEDPLVEGHPSQPSQPGPILLKIEEALAYLDRVKFAFRNQPLEFAAFIDIMKDFKTQRIEVPEVIRRVSDMFRDHPDLIVGFNIFLPPSYRIQSQPDEQAQNSNAE